MNSEPQTILVFEPLSSGHRAHFLRWLREAAPDVSDCRFVFFTADEAGDLELDRLGWWQKQKRLYDLFRQACEQYQPDQALVLELTHLELPLILFGSPVPLSAILFVQYPELPQGLKRHLKHWKTRLLLARAPVKNLFLLNGEKSCRFLSEHFSGKCRFIPLSDPASQTAAEPDFSFDADDRRVCLFFGAISRRKGADRLLDTLHRISPQAAKSNRFVFCGEPEESFRAEFNRAVQVLYSSRPDVDLHVEERFVSDERMIAMFERADLILMPYTRPEYSSGILALAAQVGTPVLGPATGLLGRLIRDHGLGLATDLTPEALEPPVTLDEKLRRTFVAGNTVENFTKPILSAVCNER